MLEHLWIGGRHTAVDNLPKGLPRKDFGDAQAAIKRLIKQGFILIKKTGYGDQASLDPKMVEQAKKNIQEPGC